MMRVDGAAERRRWEDSATSWDRWAERMADPAGRINAPMLDLSGVGSDSVVLDVAAGVGEPSLSVAAILRGGRLVSCDLVPAMLVHLRRRAAARGLATGLAAADMAALPFPDTHFDQVLCRFGLMFVPDVAAALAEMRRVLRPGGCAALAVWGPRADNSLFDRLGLILDDLLGSDPDEMLASLFRFADPSPLLSAARESGFSAARLEPLRLFQPASVDQPFWRPTLEMGFAPRLAALDQTATQSLYRAITEQFASTADAAGRVEIRMSIHLLILRA